MKRKAITEQRVIMSNISTDRLLVRRLGVPCGILRFSGKNYIFEYKKSYRGPALPGLEKNKKHQSKNLFILFESFLPEGDNLERMSFFAKCDPDDAMTLFAVYGQQTLSGITLEPIDVD